MATRSAIGLKMRDGTVVAITCHWDGYPAGVGAVLKTHYTEGGKVLELLKLGNISALHQFVNPRNDSPHSFENPQRNVTIAYHRDRGDDYHEPTVYSSCREYLNNTTRDSSSDIEYAYVGYIDSPEGIPLEHADIVWMYDEPELVHPVH